MKKIYKLLLPTVFLLLSICLPVDALKNPQYVTDWYIDSFNSTIIVNQDSSLLITEDIVADCADLPGKHGIFRVLPTQVRTEKGIIKSPIELVSITDFNGMPYKYREIKDVLDHTVTWKIGDADVIVRGVNNYRITYKVKNAVRFDNSQEFDEFYWNLSGNFWDIEIDSFSAVISFPQEVTPQNTQVDFYTGFLGEKNKNAAWFWHEDGTFRLQSTDILSPGQGITLSVTFPKGIFIPYEESFFEKYGDYLFFLITILVFSIVFPIWLKFGKDPKMKKPIPPEFEIPEDITPIQMGVNIAHGAWRDNFITATIINFAVKRIITIEEIQSSVLFFKFKDFKLTKNLENFKKAVFTPTEAILLDNLFEGADSVNLSSLKRKFYKKVPAIKKMAVNDAITNGWIVKKGASFGAVFITLGFTLCVFTIGFSLVSGLFFSLFLSGLILLVFGFLMPKRTQKGVDLLFRIKGLERYMRTAEQHRQRFYEKENIFDKLLPYAIVFGMAKLWAKKMEQIYGKEYFATYHPAWLIGASYANFNADAFVSELNSITASISSNTGTSSGAGGSGGSGGGGGGGGGGGW